MTQRIPLPEPVAKIYEAVEELQNLYPGRKFIPDGHIDLRHADQCRLGRRVDCAQLLAERGAGGDVDDTPEPGGLHTRQKGLQTLEAAAEVQRNGEVEIGWRLLLHRPRPDDPHIVDVVIGPPLRASSSAAAVACELDRSARDVVGNQTKG